MANAKARRLTNLLHTIINGETNLTPHNTSYFLEAIYTAPDAISCIHKIRASKKGLHSLQQSLRIDLSSLFLNGSASSFLQFISAPEVANIDGGAFLKDVLLKVVDPPLFWTAFVDAFRAGELQEQAQESFARLLLQLVMLPTELAASYRKLAQDKSILPALLKSPHLKVRSTAQKIKHVVDTCANSRILADLESGPGGRHDNDLVDFRQIAILPTADELVYTGISFIQPSIILEDPKTREDRIAIHLDNQFRLLREDMLYELRDEIQVALGNKKTKQRAFEMSGFRLGKIHYEVNSKPCKWGLTLQCSKDPKGLKDVKPADRKAHLAKHKRFFPHQAIACLFVNNEIVGFPSINRDEELLAKQPPIIVLQFRDQASTVKSLLRLHTAEVDRIKLLIIDTAIFSYEPVLKALQDKTTLPLSNELLLWSEGDHLVPPSNQPISLLRTIQADHTIDLGMSLKIAKQIKLDESQAKSFIAGLSQRVSLIQGPPGTGKSFIGALLAKAIHDFTTSTILVVCYTNHALDQFLEDLLDDGIPHSSIVRLGSKSTSRTAPLALSQMKNPRVPFVKADWHEIDEMKNESKFLCTSLDDLSKQYESVAPSLQELLSYLEFAEPDYFEAFTVPVSTDGMQRVGRQGRTVQPDYLLDRWCRGYDAGQFKSFPNVQDAEAIWRMPPRARLCERAKWRQALLVETVEQIYAAGHRYNTCQSRIDRKFKQREAVVLASKRIIGCTTTGAAMYREAILAARPNVLLVEEAGEILESHILTALGQDTEQLILIGDHKQLRPKVSNYKLTVEKGDGYDLNRSLFERLVLKGYPHHTLLSQHRMRPEISALVRMLTYPDLVDAPETKNRPDLMGVRANVVFINHEHGEDDDLQIEDLKDMGMKSSKQNQFEVRMVLKIVRYLAQQGYGSDKLVVLTPYLGQLRALKEALGKDHDPILNDLDSGDLVRAGLVSQSAAQLVKKPLRLATIDNYQGEESDIVIVSLTRSNANNDIGFMGAPERLNVLLSRARNALIVIGNAHTFTNARKGSAVWIRLIEHLKAQGYIYDGFPVRCERHRDREALLRCADDFDKECPDGGCSEPCGKILNCGKHPCPSKCHQIWDHSKMPCHRVTNSPCPAGHRRQWQCHKGPPLTCGRCEHDKAIAEKMKQEEFALQQKRDEEQRKHAKQIAEIDAQIARERDALRDIQLAEERKQAMLQKENDLKEAAQLTAQASMAPRKTSFLPPKVVASPQLPVLQEKAASSGAIEKPITSRPGQHAAKVKAFVPPPPKKSSARDKWQHQKDLGQTSNNDAIDAIMAMTGLEEVKEQVLRIKDKVEITQLQGSSVKGERFHACMLGNPGTGKTTIARLYGKFLASFQVIPGNMFVETTGSRLANDGVPGMKKLLEKVVNGGGGTIFVDEAYQLTSQSNFQGRQVLDLLLTELENQVGMIVFIFAGYNKEMESFFEHNPGLRSRVPYNLHFKDYQDDELMDMLEDLIKKAYPSNEMKVDDENGIKGLYGTIAVRRLGRGRDRPGFGNARALANLFARIRERQANRLAEERRQGLQPDPFLLVKEDLIGPEPSNVMELSIAWKKLQAMIGLKAVKKTILNIFDTVKNNYERELLGKLPSDLSLHRVFMGNPGTGKTTVAKYYGQILADLGLISNGEVVIKNPADFIGSALGQSESQTKAILASTLGKVLIIDEAYMLYGRSGVGNTADPYKTAVIDTIVAEVQNVPGEDRCVLLLGYTQEMEEMFQNVNPGLKRRFAVEQAFYFDDYTDSELREGLDLKLKQQDLAATDAAMTVAIEVLSRTRNRPHFGNLGEVENLLSQAKLRYQERQASLPLKDRSPDAPFEPQDFDPEFNRNETAESNLVKLFQDVVGCEEIIDKLRGWQQMARNLKAHNKDPRNFVPTNFVFKGPPGTGKTTIARKMGQVYYDMGFLSSSDVVECSASDLVGEYVGQTGPKTKKLFEKALGRVLFIDEAYRLSEGHFAKEAIDELVGILTNETFRAKLVVILAGYDQNMNDLMAVNSGLSSRFPEEIIFRNLSSEKCLEILRRNLRNANITLDALENPSCADYARLLELINNLSLLPSWGNARDISTLSKRMATAVYATPSLSSGLAPADAEGLLKLDGKDAISCLESMLSEQWERTTNLPHSLKLAPDLPPRVQGPQVLSPKTIRTMQTTTESAAPPPPYEGETGTEIQQDQMVSETRDLGVTDQIWHQLQADKHRAEEEKMRSEEKMRLLQEEQCEEEAREKAAAELVRELAKAVAKGEAEEEELMRKREQERLRMIKAMEARARLTAELEKQERMKREEVQVQKKLRQMGVCVAGFQWIKQTTGYRCAGGSHFVGNEALEL